MAESSYRDYRTTRLEAAVVPDPTPEPEVPLNEVAEVDPVEDTPEEIQAEDEVSPTEDEQEETEDEETEEQAVSRRRARTEQRFKRLNDRARRIERENAELKGQISVLSRLQNNRLAPEPEPEAEPGPEPERPPVVAGRPSRDDFPDDDDFIEAMADWKAETKIKAEVERQSILARRSAEEREMGTLQEAHAQRIEQAKAKYPDFEEVVTNSKDVNLTDVVVRAVMESEQGGDIVRHFALNPEDADRLNKLSPVALGKALAKLEARYGEEVADDDDGLPPTGPRAPDGPPEPIRPVRTGNAAPRVRRPIEQLSYRDYRGERISGRIR